MPADPSKLPQAITDEAPWSSGENAIWPATILMVRRNLSHYRFPSKLEKAEAAQVEEKLQKAFEKEATIQPCQFFQSDALSPNQKQLVFEHFLFLHGGEAPPQAASFVVDQKGRFLALINGDNHLEMRALHVQGSLEQIWKTLSLTEASVGRACGFAFSPKFGYLTSNPSHCGTGLTVSAYLHLPALTRLGELENHLPLPGEEDVRVISLSGKMEELIGDIVILQNHFTLGLTEEAIIHSIQTAANKLVAAEKAAREKIKKEETAKIKDLVSKAYGLLMHSYKLETTETFDLLSLIKLGLNLGWITSIEDHMLSKLLFCCRRGHLSEKFPQLANQEEIAHKRAELLHSELKKMQLSPHLQ